MFAKAGESGLTIRDLSKILDIPETRIYNWKAKRGEPKPEDFAKIQTWLAGYANIQPVSVPVDPVDPAQLVEIRALLDALLADYAENIGLLRNRSSTDVLQQVMLKAMKNLSKGK